jgi:UDP-N-acetylmuramoyl-tripeptide--D-alanyl-D-alanine ligase
VSELVDRIRRAVRGRGIIEALEWRWHRVEATAWTRLRAAHVYRRHALRGVTFIGVTGSGGKTTTKELAAAVLATRMTGRRSPGNLTGSPYLERTVMRTRPRDGFCIVETPLGSEGPQRLEAILRLIRPSIGVVTVIGSDHLSFYGSLEGIAAAKGRLVEVLPARGTAVLNADDPLVRDMARRTRARVITYGLAQDADLRARDVRVRWPERLSFTVRHGDEEVEVRTQFLAEHFLSDVLAALAVGVAMGVPLSEGAAVVEAVPPFGRRLSPVAHPDGYTVVSDDIKAPVWSMPAAFAFVEDARAERKVVVLGTISDYAGNSDKAYAALARQALEAADLVVFVGNNSAKSLRARRGEGDVALQAFYSVEVAAEFLRAELRRGDLVLLKGSESDRLDLIAAELMQPEPAVAGRELGVPDSGGRLQVVVGLGNQGARYADAPHNVGHRVLDRLATALGATWEQERDAAVARVADGDRTLCLVKPAARMNASGPLLARVARRIGFGAPDLVLVHDDLDLSIRQVRVRERSGDAGHRGVRSVLQAFRTDEIRRVRVGVGRPPRGQPADEYVLEPFALQVRADVDGAVAEAADRVLELLGRPERVRGRAARGADG